MSRENGRTRPIHVLEVLGNAIVGGMESHVHSLIRCLRSAGFQFTCLCPYESGTTAELRNLGCEVVVTHMEDDPPWNSIQHTVELIRSRRIDLVHAHLPRAQALGGLAAAITRRPLVTTFHGMKLTAQEFGIQRTTGTHMIVVCRHAYLNARSLGIREENLSLIYNGVDLKRFSINGDGRAFRTAVNIPDEAPLVGFVGRLSLEKGPDLFLQAARFVHERRADVHFVLVGSGPLEDELRVLCKQMDLEQVVHFAGLWKNMTDVFPAFDVIAQPSRIEGTPMVLLEAMASGRPVIAVGVGGVIELVEVDVSGRLLGPGDWKGVGEQLLNLLEDPALREKMGRAARLRVESDFTVEHTAEQTGALFRSLVRRRQPEAHATPTVEASLE